MKKLFLSFLTACMFVLTPITVFAENDLHSTSQPTSVNEQSKHLNNENSIDPLKDFSPNVEEWTKWFNSLTPEEQLTVNYRPAGFNTLSKQSVPTNEVSYPNETYDEKSNYQKSSLAPLAQSKMVTGGYEHPYSPSSWIDLTDKANCYAYMLNISTYSGHKLQPGEKAGQTFSSLTTSSIYSASLKDMPYLGKKIRTSSYSETPGYREYKVALVIAPNYDYHWYRQDRDGGWSHKRGLTSIDFRDASLNPISDPQVANRNYGNGLNYSTWGGYYMITY